MSKVERTKDVLLRVSRIFVWKIYETIFRIHLQKVLFLYKNFNKNLLLSVFTFRYNFIIAYDSIRTKIAYVPFRNLKPYRNSKKHIEKPETEIALGDHRKTLKVIKLLHTKLLHILLVQAKNCNGS